MAIFECKQYPEMTVYITKDKKVQFRRGKLETKDPKVINILKKVQYVKRVDEESKDNKKK